MKTTLFLACVWVAVLGITLWPGTSSPHIAAVDAKGKQGVDLPKDDPLLQAIQKRFGKPDRVTGSGRAFIHYDLSNGETLTFVVSGAKVLGTEHKTKQPKGDLSDAIQSRLGKPDRVTGSGRAFIHYELSNGDTLTLVVSDGQVLGASQTTPDAPTANDLEDVLFPLPPREVAAGRFEQWQREAAQKPSNVTYTRVEYDDQAYWVVDATRSGYGDPPKKIAVYAPTKDGSFWRCLLAGPIKTGKLAVAADAKTGMVEVREVANSRTKGEVVLSCNLKAIGVLP
jgi:hypothetical protein